MWLELTEPRASGRRGGERGNGVDHGGPGRPLYELWHLFQVRWKPLQIFEWMSAMI